MRLAPRIHLLALDPEIRPVGEYLVRNLDFMRDSVIDIGIALDLWEHARDALKEHHRRTVEGQRYVEWGRMAASHIAILLSSIHEVMQANSADLFYRLPLVASNIDQGKMSQARAQFAARFDGISLLRHDAAHPGEFGATPESEEKHSATGQVDLISCKWTALKPSYMSGQILNGHYVCTVRGRLLSLLINRSLVTDLAAITTIYFDAFERVTEVTEALSLERRG